MLMHVVPHPVVRCRILTVFNIGLPPLPSLLNEEFLAGGICGCSRSRFSRCCDVPGSEYLYGLHVEEYWHGQADRPVVTGVEPDEPLHRVRNSG